MEPVKMSVGLRQALGDVDDVSQIYAELGLTKQSVFYGREEKMKEILELLTFDKDGRTKQQKSDKIQNTSLINVCGMTGIGKSYLVKQVALKFLTDIGSPVSVIYVDASGLTDISNLLVKILEHHKVGRFASGSKGHLIGLFLDYLKTNQKQIILMIDDLSSLMDASKEGEVQSFFNDILECKRRNKLKVKIVTTIQRELTTPTQSQSPEAEIRDIALDRFDTDTSRKLLHYSVDSLDTEIEEKLLNSCNGHPFSLHVLSKLYADGFSMSEDLQDFTYKGENEATDKLFLKALDRIPASQQQILMAMSCFENDVTLDSLHFILNLKGSCRKFVQNIPKEFESRFWLSFKSITVSQAWIRKKRTIVANIYHPLIKGFLRRTVSSHINNRESKSQKEMLQMKERFVTYHISKLSEIGKDCLENEAMACQTLMNTRANLRTALSEMVELQDPRFFFSTPNADGVHQLRSPEDIAHLFIALLEYHDCFEGQLLRTLKMFTQNSNAELPVEYRILIQTAHIMALSAAKDWTTLDKILKTMKREEKPEMITEKFPHLSDLCSAVHGYAQGRIYAIGPMYKNVLDSTFVATKQKCLDNALGKLEDLPKAFSGQKKYFMIHLLVVKAEATWLANRKQRKAIQEALDLSKLAESYAEKAPILKPLAHFEIASYLAIKGNYYYNTADPPDYDAADECYAEALPYHQKVADEYKKRNMENCTTAVKNLQGVCMLNRSLGNCLTRDLDKMTKEMKAGAIKYYKASAMYAEQAERGFTILNSSSKLHLAKAILNKARSLEGVVEQLQPTKKGEVGGGDYKYYLSLIQQAYAKCYNLVLTDPTHCDLVDGDPTLMKLKENLPSGMKISGYPKKEIEQISKQLKIIAENSKSSKKKTVDVTALLVEQINYDDGEHRLVSTAVDMRLDSDNMKQRETETNLQGEGSGISKKSKTDQ